MNTHDIELPPLPKASKMYDIPGYDEEELKNYAREAIESYLKRRGGPAYHPCTSILIEGLKRLPGGSAILAEWDKARSRVDASQPAEPVKDDAKASVTSNDLAHEIWAAAQTAPCEGIEDAVKRVAALLARYGQVEHQGGSNET